MRRTDACQYLRFVTPGEPYSSSQTHGRRLGYESVSGLQVRQLNWREYCTCYFVRT